MHQILVCWIYRCKCYFRCWQRRTMPLSTQSQADIDQYILIASLDNARNLSNILKAISFRDHAIFNATQNGIKVTVEDSKCLQANAFIQVSVGGQCLTGRIYRSWVNVCVCLIPQAEIFQEYIIKEDTVGFQVNLTVLLDCLTIFGGSTIPGVCHNDDPVFCFGKWIKKYL